MAGGSSSRISRDRIVRDLRQAARKGDRASLTLAVTQMRTLALSPRYWERYLGLLRNPLARLVDLLVIKQGDRIAHQKGWKLAGASSAPDPPEPAGAGGPRPRPRPGRKAGAGSARRPAPRRPSERRAAGPDLQSSLFEELEVAGRPPGPAGRRTAPAKPGRRAPAPVGPRR
jgi:hypothetical protein